MCILLVVLYVSLVAAPGHTSLPRQGDSLSGSPVIDITSPPIEGLNSISHELELLDNELRSLSSNILSQIQTDVASMAGSVRSLAQTMNCSIQDRPSREISNIVYPESYLYQTLTKLQRYLEKFILNKDKLKVC